MSSILIHCDICFNDLSLDCFGFLECGHGACTDCLNNEKLDRRLCPICRAPRRGGRRIFMTFAAAPGSDGSRVGKEGSGDATTANFRRAVKKARLVAKSLDKTTKDVILGAVKRLELESEHLSAARQLQLDENEALAEEMQNLQEILADVEAEAAKYKSELSETLGKLHAAVEAQDEAKRRVTREKKENARSKEMNEKLRWVIQVKDKDIEQCKLALNECEKEKTIAKKKLNALLKQAKPSIKVQDANDSLQVLAPENSEDEEEVSRRPKKRRVSKK